MTLHGCFKTRRIEEIRRKIGQEILLCAPATIGMLLTATAAITIKMGTPTVPMTTVKLPAITTVKLPERHISGSLS